MTSRRQPLLVTVEERDQLRQLVAAAPGSTAPGSASAPGRATGPRRDNLPGAGAGVGLFVVKQVFNDYTLCDRIDAAGAVMAEDIPIAKPPELRHAASWYDGVTTITTVDAQTVTAATGSVSETWEVYWPYIVDTTLIVAIYATTGVTVGSDAVRWLELNLGQRRWTLQE